MVSACFPCNLLIWQVTSIDLLIISQICIPVLSPVCSIYKLPHSSTLAWRIPWMEEPGRLQSMGSLRVDTTEQLHFHISLSCLEKEMATQSSVLAWRIPGTGEPGGLPSMGSHRVGHD